MEQTTSNAPSGNEQPKGHPTLEELREAQATKPITDPADLLGDFWPQDESIEDFLAAWHEWRGHTKTDRAA